MHSVVQTRRDLWQNGSELFESTGMPGKGCCCCCGGEQLGAWLRVLVPPPSTCHPITQRLDRLSEFQGFSLQGNINLKMCKRRSRIAAKTTI